jgi:DNA-binding NtrC family response regulator
VSMESNIIVADRNPHVRQFLKREFGAAGYHVHLAESGKEVIKIAYQSGSCDVLILDPDLPDTDPAILLDELCTYIPRLPVVIHSFSSNIKDLQNRAGIITIIEKSGNSIETLKELVAGILQKSGCRSEPSEE